MKMNTIWDVGYWVAKQNINIGQIKILTPKCPLILLIGSFLLFSSLAYSESGHETAWGYKGKNGPNTWGTLSPSFFMCNEGMQQSPIDIITGSSGTYYPLQLSYSDHSLNVVNNGHTLQMNMFDQKHKNVQAADHVIDIAGKKHYPSYMMLGPQKYDLAQFHFHSPSEHSIDGEHYPLEIHFVHKNSVGALAVIGVLFKTGSTNKTFQALLDNAPNRVGYVEKSSMLSANDLMVSDLSYYHYQGSLTTPPCSEDVKWFVMSDVLEISNSQKEQFLKIIGENARPTQALNWRNVLMQAR
ncbi:carbonic anhydrase family protein [Vibrio lamellibrachiae]|uniref:carbonic anhydrase n=1 Tax=Vibrio lamellibrachiae TaxID=2910253 RepID=UPI003D0B92E2